MSPNGEDLGEEIRRVEDERDRLQAAFNVAVRGLAEKNAQNNAMTTAINSAMQLIEHLVGELHANNIRPRPALEVAHDEFKRAMQKLLGHDQEPHPDRGSADG